MILKKQNYLLSDHFKKINVVCCVGSVEIQIEIKKCRCTADMESEVQRFERRPFVSKKHVSL